MTLAELVLWKKLRDRNIFSTKFRKQHPIDIFIVDFYCHEYKLVIEVDEEVHANEELTEYDLGRSAELNKFGIRIIRFSNDQIIYNIDSLITEIREVIAELAPLLGGWGHSRQPKELNVVKYGESLDQNRM